jgi:hypothetical protein
MSKYSTNSKPIYAGEHVVGCVKGDTFHKTIKGSRHILFHPRALALSVESLKQAESFGARAIEIRDTESGLIYRATLEHFKRFCFELKRGTFEPQRALMLDRWDVSGGNPSGNHPMRIDPAETTPEALPIEEEIQMSLF